MLIFPRLSILYASEACHLPTSSQSEAAIVKWVYDGDTLLVTNQNGNNKRKIRLIGIDTPEVKHHQQKAQRYGAKAREELRVLLKQYDYQVILESDEEKHDRYDRKLAYVYLPDGRSVSEWLLRKGYAKSVIFPPNVKYAHCYKNAERYAQQKKLKLWQLKSNRLKLNSDLKKSSRGYLRLKAKVSSYRETKKAIYLSLENNKAKSKQQKPIQLKISKKHLRYFKKLNLKQLVDREVIVSGFLKNRKGKRTISLNHSAQIEVIASNKNDLKPEKPTIEWSKVK